MGGRLRGWTLPWLAASFAALAGCDLAGESVHRGRVIDQDTGEPVAGAIVAGRYMGGLNWGGMSCNRAESAVTDAQGRFELPIDPREGTPLMEAYKHGYDRGGPHRHAILKTEWPREWRVVVLKWSNGNATPEIASEEPGIYRTQSAALEASGEKRDVFVRRSRSVGAERLKELHGFQKHCQGPPHVSDGMKPFLEAILREQVELGDREDAIAITQRALEYSPGRK